MTAATLNEKETQKVLASELKVGDVIMPPAREMRLWIRRSLANEGRPESDLHITITSIQQGKPDKRGAWLVVRGQGGFLGVAGWCIKMRPDTRWPVVQRAADWSDPHAGEGASAVMAEEFEPESRSVLNDVEIKDGVRIVTATVEGIKYEIPEHWLMGATLHRSFDEALRIWHEQATLEQQVEKNGIEMPATPYTKEIKRLLGVLGVGSADPILVEAWMRVDHPTFDALSKVDFALAVKSAWESYAQAGEVESRKLAQSFGLVR